MIFYFSATGNSLYTAQKLALSLQEPICNIIDFINQNNFNYILKQGERFGLVFPVYAWGLPKPVITFLKNIQISSFTPYYTFAVITCGENIGTSMNTLKKILKKKFLHQKNILRNGFLSD